MTVDRRQAVRVDLAVGNDVVCPAGPRWLYLWRDTSAAGEGAAIQVYGDGWLPLAILDVDGQTIVFEIWSGDDWMPTGRTDRRLDPLPLPTSGRPSPTSPTRTP